MPVVHPIDWPAVLADIAYQLGEMDPTTQRRTPLGRRLLARELNVADGTVRGWQEGSEPRHADGEMLLARWRALTGKPQEFAPRERRPLAAAQR